MFDLFDETFAQASQAALNALVERHSRRPAAGSRVPTDGVCETREAITNRTWPELVSLASDGRDSQREGVSHAF